MIKISFFFFHFNRRKLHFQKTKQKSTTSMHLQTCLTLKSKINYLRQISRYLRWAIIITTIKCATLGVSSLPQKKKNHYDKTDKTHFSYVILFSLLSSNRAECFRLVKWHTKLLYECGLCSYYSVCVPGSPICDLWFTKSWISENSYLAWKEKPSCRVDKE